MKLIRYEYPQAPGTSAFNRLFELGAPAADRFGSIFEDFFGTSPEMQRPAVDLYEDDHNYYARMELPGMKKEAIDLELENSVLTVSSTRSEKTENGESAFSFQRSIAVPDGVDLGKVAASHEDGILTITMPKEAARKPRQINIK